MNLSCVAPIVDTETLVYVEEMQKLLRVSFNTSFNADTWIPHVTLGHQLEVSQEELPALKDELDEFLEGVGSLTLPVTGFNVLKKESIKPPRLPWVINVGLEATPEVRQVCSELQNILEKRNVTWRFEGENGIDFLRLTLASRDLREEDALRFCSYAKDNPCELKSVSISSIALIELGSSKSENTVAYEKSLV